MKLRQLLWITQISVGLFLSPTLCAQTASAQNGLPPGFVAAKQPIKKQSIETNQPKTPQTEKTFTPIKTPISKGKVVPPSSPIMLTMESLSRPRPIEDFMLPSKTAYVGQSMPEAENDRVWFLLGKSAEAIQEYLPQFQIVVLNATDPSVRLFAANGLLKQSENEFTHKTHGLASFYMKGSRINKEKVIACYIVYNADLGGHLWRNFISPFKTYRAGTDFLVAHEVAHCIDSWEKDEKLSDKSWSLSDASKFGIEEHAWKRVVQKDTVTKSDYFKNLLSLARDNAYQQYQERVADAFAVLWTKGRGSVGSVKEITDVLDKTRGVQSAWASHNTSAVFKDLLFPDSAKTAMDIWAASRAQQLKVSVDESVITGEHAGFKDPALKALQDAKQDPKDPVLKDPVDPKTVPPLSEKNTSEKPPVPEKPLASEKLASEKPVSEKTDKPNDAKKMSSSETKDQELPTKNALPEKNSAEKNPAEKNEEKTSASNTPKLPIKTKEKEKPKNKIDLSLVDKEPQSSQKIADKTAPAIKDPLPIELLTPAPSNKKDVPQKDTPEKDKPKN